MCTTHKLIAIRSCGYKYFNMLSKTSSENSRMFKDDVISFRFAISSSFIRFVSLLLDGSGERDLLRFIFIFFLLPIKHKKQKINSSKKLMIYIKNSTYNFSMANIHSVLIFKTIRRYPSYKPITKPYERLNTLLKMVLK